MPDPKLIKFFSALYDEWVLRPWSSEKAFVDVGTCRALRHAFGDASFEATMTILERDQKIKRLPCDMRQASPQDHAIQLLDYAS